MFETYRDAGPEPIGFVLVPGFSMMAFLSAVEPLRVANRLAGRELFRWGAFSPDGEPIPASNGMTMVTQALPSGAGLPSDAMPPTLIVCAGFEPQKGETRALLGLLRRAARRGTALGALDTGTHVLAAAGLLEDHRVTMHWEAVAGFREEFPGITVSDELFEISGNRFTCAGGTAALDMMLHMIGLKHGHALAIAVSEQFIHDRIRDRRTHQRMQVGNRLGITNQRLIRIVETMEQNLEQPLGSEALALVAGISARQLERLFRSGLDQTPSAYYLRLRLSRARQLLRQTDMSVMEVAMATGFSSASCLSRAYRTGFGHSPRQDRREASAWAAAE